MDALRNQLMERKTIDLILASAMFKVVPYELELPPTEAIDAALAGGAATSDIPAAEHGNEPVAKHGGNITPGAHATQQ